MSQKMFRLFSLIKTIKFNKQLLFESQSQQLQSQTHVFRRSYPSWGPPKPKIDKNEIAARVLKTIGFHDKIDKTILTTSSHFMNDLSLDSLDVIEIVMQIEDEFKIEISDIEAEKMLTVSDIIDYTIKQLDEYVSEYQRPPIEYRAGEVEEK